MCVGLNVCVSMCVGLNVFVCLDISVSIIGFIVLFKHISADSAEEQETF